MHQYLAQVLQLPWMGGTTTHVEGPITSGVFGSVSGSFSLGSIISRAVTFVFIFAGIGLFVMLLAGGFTFLTSAGDAKKLEQGRQQLTNALLGFLVIFVAFWLVQALGIVFGVDTFKNIFG